jgi:alkylation response protein AidB-like acyl-CoA dehydrogenase
VAEAALDLLGPEGLIAGESMSAFLNSRCLTIAGGTTQILLSVAAERILGLPR